MRTRWWRAVGAAAGCAGLGPWVWAASVTLVSVDLDRSVVNLYERCELTVRVDGGPVKNPYDPQEIIVEAVFQPPQGRPLTMPGFYYQPFERIRDGGQDVVQAAGTPVWKVRLTPRHTGRWTYAVQLRTPGGTQRLPGGTFQVVGSARPGFLRVHRESRSLRFDDGTTFIPIGENLAWGPSVRPLQAYDRWFQNLTNEGVNYIRVWLAPWSLRLETKQTGLGRYDQQRAWQLDYLLERSEQLGLYWQLCLLDHGSFSRTQDAAWHDNPYNEQLGGMCRVPNDFVTDLRAKAQFQQLLRYLVSRWGYSPNLAGWELFNEGDLSEIQVKDFVPWVAEMSQFLRLIDPNRHLITVSYHQAAPEGAWALPAIDLVQMHLYDRRDFGEVFCSPMVEELRSAVGKPVMIGEYGWITDFVRRIDAYGIHLHDGLWASLAGGAVGSAMVWYWDVYVEPNGLERHFRPLARFWRGEQISEALQPVRMSVSDAGVLGCGVGTPARAYVWLKNRAHTVDDYLAYRCALAKQRIRQERGQAPEAVSYPSRIVRRATMTVRGLGWPGGRYRIEWWDPYRGRVLSRMIATVQRGTLTVPVPDVVFDVAAKLVRLKWWERS